MLDNTKISNYNEKKYLFISFTMISLILGIVSLYVNTPSIFYDELVYTSLSKNIWFNSELGFRGQGVDYSQIIYSLLIIPSFLFKNENWYQIIKFLGCIYMSSSIIPIYYILKELEVEITQKNRLIYSILIFLSMDIGYSLYATSEVIYCPIFIWAYYLIIKSIKNKNLTKIEFVLPLIIFLLVQTKIVGLFLFFSYIIFMIKQILKDRNNFKKMLIVLIIFVMFYILFKSLYVALNPLMSESVNIYKGMLDNAIKEINLNNIRMYLNGFFLYLKNTILGFYIFPIIILLPYAFKNTRYKNEIQFLFLSMTIYILGIVFTIYMVEDIEREIARYHSRYIFPFLPIILCYLISISKENNNIIKEKLIFCVYFLIFSEFKFNGFAYVFDSINLSCVIKINDWVSNNSYLFNIIILFFITLIIYIYIHKKNKNSNNIKYIIVFTAIISSLNMFFVLESRHDSFGEIDNVIEVSNNINNLEGNKLLLSDLLYDNKTCKLEMFLEPSYKTLTIKELNENIRGGKSDLNNIFGNAGFAGSNNQNKLKNIEYLILKTSLLKQDKLTGKYMLNDNEGSKLVLSNQMIFSNEEFSIFDISNYINIEQG